MCVDWQCAGPCGFQFVLCFTSLLELKIFTQNWVRFCTCSHFLAQAWIHNSWIHAYAVSTTIQAPAHQHKGFDLRLPHCVDYYCWKCTAYMEIWVQQTLQEPCSFCFNLFWQAVTVVVIVMQLPSSGYICSCNDKSHSESHCWSTFFVVVSILCLNNCFFHKSKFMVVLSEKNKQKTSIKRKGSASINMILTPHFPVWYSLISH